MEHLHIFFWFFVLLCNFSGLTLEVKKWGPDKLWPRFTDFGQISAVTVDLKGDIYVFHRGDRKWDASTFDSRERYANPLQGPIKSTTIVVLDGDGNLITATGEDLFFMPHGLTIDDDNNVWVTDVGLHQVFKFPPIDKAKNKTILLPAELTLGKALTPERGRNGFCKPTAVAIDSKTKDFFVADGYCNSRIVKFDWKGNMLIQWGIPADRNLFQGPFNMRVPHSLAIDEARSQILVADRENSRVLCYTIDGQFLHQINTGGRVYGISYSPVTDSLYAVLAASYLMQANGLVFSMKEGNLTDTFSPDQNFQNAHDVAVSPDGQHIYVVELDPFLLWRFTVGIKIPDNDANSLPAAITESHNTTTIPKAPAEQILSNLGANQIAVTVVTLVVLIGIVAVTCHLFRKKDRTYAMEMRGLILDDEDERIF